MKKLSAFIILFVLINACKTSEKIQIKKENPSEFTIAFGSCNNHILDNLLWDDVVAAKPDVWVWGGDIIYADTDNVERIKAMYTAQNSVPGYKQLKKEVPVIGTWDDHDYGLNDGGAEFSVKKQSEQAFLDFMEVPKDSPRRNQDGIYTAHDYDLPMGMVKIIVLDTRYFRTALTPDTETRKRFKPNVYGKGTVLGVQQWRWLAEQLGNSKADFNLIVSSIQFLSNEHGFECWGNFPHEVDRLRQLIADSKAQGVLILSGDRHISEFSKTQVTELPYPLIDFTSSGLTHSYSSFSEESNPYRIGEVISTKSFGLVKLNLKLKEASLLIIGNNGEILEKLRQRY